MAVALVGAVLVASPIQASGPVAAAAKKKAPKKGSGMITGKLSRSGYTVIALDAGGQAKSVVANPKFKLRPPANKVTLQLRGPDGAYAGPIVFVGDKGGKAKKSKKGKTQSKRVIVGVKASASLGKVKLMAGFAVAKGVARKSLDIKRTATAKKGVPIGAGNFGRVAVSKLKGPSSDPDLDGVPNPLDVDDDGDLVLDDADSNEAGGARAAQTPAQQPNPLAAFTSMLLEGVPFPGNPGQPVNVNAPGLGDADIEATLRSYGNLSIGTPPMTSAELDCGLLVYCSAGGTGKRLGGAHPYSDPNPQPFPACCDPDGDGLGSLDVMTGGTGLALRHGAGSDQIRGGDLLIARGPAPVGPEVESVGTLGSVVATVTALASYTDELGVTRPVSYPITSDSPPLQVVDGPDADSDVSVRLTFWRPQRRALPEEASTGGWVDMGNLVQLAHTLITNSDSWCPEDSYSQWEGGLVPSMQGLPGGSGLTPAFTFLDSAPDRPASPDNTFSYTLNISRCLSFRGESFGPGQGMLLHFTSQFPVHPGQAPVSGTVSAYRFHHQP